MTAWMRHRVLLNGIRGLAGSMIAFPLAERLERRDMRSKQRLFAAEMARPVSERRSSSWDAAIKTIQFAALKVPYYRDLFGRIGFDPDALTRDPKFLNDIPLLTKDIIRAEGERLLREDHADYRKHVAKTGGSTGPSAHIYYDQNAADWSSAVTRHARAMVGAGPMQSELHFASKFPDAPPLKDRVREYVKCLSNNRYNIFFDSFEPAELDKIWRELKSIRPHLVHGHPSTLYRLALHVEAVGDGGAAFGVFESSGELLETRYRQAIARVFGCRIIDRYGLAEIGVVAYQFDSQQAKLQIFDALAWPEIFRHEASSELYDREAVEGELVLTGLKNRMMPLIRYRTGDIATLETTATGFMIGKIVGRVHDVVEIAGRRLPTHYVQDILDRVGGVKEFQIEIRDNRPVFRIVAEADADLNALRDRLAGWWGDAITVEFIDSTALHLQGWRSKFRHLVGPSNDHL